MLSRVPHTSRYGIEARWSDIRFCQTLCRSPGCAEPPPTISPKRSPQMGRHDGPTVDIGGNLGSWETPATPLDRTSSRRAQRVLLSPDSLTTWYVTWRWQTDVKRGAVAIHVPETVSISGGSHHAASPTRELA